MKHTSKGDDETTRSGLFLEAIRIIKEMREATHGEYPTFALWENVPGAFSSNGGDDFRVVLEELAKIAESGVSVPRPPKWEHAGCIMGDDWSIAWRVLDAQYWGVPQRRRRIYLVADFGGQRAGKVLFEREGLRRNFKEIRETFKAVTGDVGVGLKADSGAGTFGFPLGFRPENTRLYRETATTLCNGTRAGFCNAVVYDCRGGGDGRTVNTLTGDHNNRVTDYTAIVCMASGQANAEICQDVCPTLSCLHEAPIISRNLVVRRLTPTECSRLQGFPFNWGDIPNVKDLDYEFWRNVRQTYEKLSGKQPKVYSDKQLLKWYNSLHSDTAEYKLWGNGIALPTVLYVMEGIADELQKNSCNSSEAVVE